MIASEFDLVLRVGLVMAGLIVVYGAAVEIYGRREQWIEGWAKRSRWRPWRR